jgi:hypothetical protein
MSGRASEVRRGRPARADAAVATIRTRATPRMAWLFSAVFATFGWAAGIRPLSDNSFFWHLRAGEWILDHGIPRQDPFSYTAARASWVAQSWLAEVVYGALNRSVGAVGIRLLGALVGSAIALLSYQLALRLVRDRVRAALIALAALTGIVTLWSERPLLLGVLFLLGLVWIVEVPESLVGRHAVVTVPVLMWLWVNVHGTFALGFVYLGLHLLGRWADGASPFVAGRERRLLLASAIASVTIFANPYGARLVVFPIRLLARSDALANIVEWRTPDLRKPSGVALALWLCVFVVAVARGTWRVSRRDVVVSLPFLVLALWALRNVALAPFIGLPVVARAWARPGTARDELRPGVALMASSVILLLVVTISVRALAQPDFEIPPSQPVTAMRFVAAHGLLGRRILNNDPAGGYIIFAYSPRQKVFIDDRFDMYPRHVISDYFSVAKGEPGLERILNRYDIEVVVWPSTTPLAAILNESPRWRRLHRDPHASVWVRSTRGPASP